LSTAVGNVVLSLHDNRFVVEESGIFNIAVDYSWPIYRYLGILNFIENVRNIWLIDDILGWKGSINQVVPDLFVQLG